MSFEAKAHIAFHVHRSDFEFFASFAWQGYKPNSHHGRVSISWQWESLDCSVGDDATSIHGFPYSSIVKLISCVLIKSNASGRIRNVEMHLNAQKWLLELLELLDC